MGLKKVELNVMLKKVFLSLVFIAALFLFPSKILAQVVINEFSSSTSSDWVELYSNEDIDISGWILRDNASSIVKSIPNSTLIGPSGSVPKYYVIDAGSRLNVDTDKIRLLKSDDSTTVDQVSYGGAGEICAPIGSQTIGRFPNGTGNFVRFSVATDWRENNASQDPCPTPTPTPTTIPSVVPSPTPTLIPASYPSDVYLSEFMANPSEGKEWVEIYNDNSSSVSLNSWKIRDSTDSNYHQFSVEIEANSYKVVEISDFILNNEGGDSVKLARPDGIIEDEKSYSSTTKGKSWAKDNDGDWCQVDPTPNSSNPDCPGESSSTTSTATSTPTPTSKVTPTPTKKVTPTPSPKATPTEATASGEILGEEATRAAFNDSGLVMGLTEENPATGSGKKTWLAKIFMGLGLLTLFGAGFSFWYTQIREKDKTGL